jgi:glycosyltransferase involved in cell wall biosynthesis
LKKIHVNISEHAAWRPEIDERPFQPLGLPLVSVIIDNYNYGRFLREAVESVFRQSYPSIECIIVDDASADNSRTVIQDILRDHPDVTAVLRPENGGQSLACKDGFEASSGQYVIFLDADDFLLPSAVETHVFVHLSLRVPVGFTSGDMLQSVDDQIVVGTRQTLSDYIRSEQGKKPGLLRPIDKSLGELSPLQSPAELEDKVHLVESASAFWVWSPMSGNCFRRDALRLVFDNQALSILKRSADAYLNLGINALTGSVLIDQPLAVYRHHGGNGLARHPQLNGLFSFKRGRGPDNSQRARLLLIDYFMENADDLIRRSSALHFTEALQELGRHASFHGAPYYLSRLVRKNWNALREHLGFWDLSKWVLILMRRKI